VKQFRPGDEVFGWCEGAFAEYACAPENNFLPKPASLTFEQAAAVGDSVFTALDAVRDQGKVRPGHEVLISGASGGVDVRGADRQVVRSAGDRLCSTRKHR
jgi:NADPH:quinone reductase-like Zn-dependent oxidoreductase